MPAAPLIAYTNVGKTFDDGRVVAVRQRNVIATAFHPELAGETRFHRLVATMAAVWPDYDTYATKTDRKIPIVICDPPR